MGIAYNLADSCICIVVTGADSIVKHSIWYRLQSPTAFS